MPSSNPFDGWVQQCFGSFTGWNAGGDRAWCALGWLQDHGLPCGHPLVMHFNGWLIKKHDLDVIACNDLMERPPKWFAVKWEQFLNDTETAEPRDPLRPWPINSREEVDTKQERLELDSATTE